MIHPDTLRTEATKQIKRVYLDWRLISMLQDAADTIEELSKPKPICDNYGRCDCQDSCTG